MASQLIELKPEHIEEAAELLAKNFGTFNPMWSSFKFEHKDILQHFTNELRFHLQSQEKIRKEFNKTVTFNVVLI